MNNHNSPGPGRELPRWLSDLIKTPPSAGTGLHPWIFRAACALKPWRTDAEIAALLTAATLHSGRDLTREIREAIAHAPAARREVLLTSSAPAPHAAGGGRPLWPARDLRRIAAVADEGAGLAELWETSPERLEGDWPDAETLIDVLFPNNSLLCVADTPAGARTLPREEWRGRLSERSLIVPSPMTARTGRRQDGGVSHRCLDNTGPRRFLVVEFDFKFAGPLGYPTEEAPLLARLAEKGRTVLDLCAALLLHLHRYAPLLLAVHSGGKSLHGWFRAVDVPESTLTAFFRLAVLLGADPATWTRCQLVRMPEGLRYPDKCRQRLWFLNPKRLPPRRT